LELSEEQKERQKLERATWKQKLFIERLGGSMSSTLSKFDASQLIDKLMNEPGRIERARQTYEQEGYPPSPRQRMVAKFWNVSVKIAGAEQTGWMDDFYLEDQDRLAAWTTPIACR
jgi:hypothetical protein